MNEPSTMYTCPMHPNVRSEHEGMCPECGMALVPAKEHQHVEHQHTSEEEHQGHSKNMFRTRFWICLVLTIPILFYADVAQQLIRYQAPTFPGSDYVPLLLASIVFFYGGSIFLSSAYREIRGRRPGMMTLIALAITTAYLYSIYVVFTGGEKTLFWELATLITVMLLGHWMEMRAVSGAQAALGELSKLLPEEAEVLRNGKPERVPVAELQVGDKVLVRPGARVPIDGTITEGTSDVDESIATGESTPVAKAEGDQVIGGTMNGDGALTMTVTHIGEETFLAGVMRLVEEAQRSKSNLQLLSDRAALYLTFTAITVGGITLVAWLFLDTPAFAIERAVAVLVITCPHALGLAIPLVASISTTKAAKNGFLVRNRLALELARNVDVVLFDKTGTLTTGSFGVQAVLPVQDVAAEDLLKTAGAVNTLSEHPIAMAVVHKAAEEGITPLQATAYKRIPGKGAEAMIDGTRVIVGSAVLMGELGIQIPTSLEERLREHREKGHTINFVVRGQSLLGAFALADVIREESREAIQKLKSLGIKTAMITGDAQPVADWVAGELGIDTVFAEVLPDQKSRTIQELQEQGMKVAMVGDGVNDAPALTQADLGIAIGAGTNVAIESAGIILVKNDPRDIPKIIRLSQLTYTKMLQNLFWATGYNVLAIPLAAGVFAFAGFFLQPALSAFLMSLSTVIVAANALLLRRQPLTS